MKKRVGAWQTIAVAGTIAGMGLLNAGCWEILAIGAVAGSGGSDDGTDVAGDGYVYSGTTSQLSVQSESFAADLGGREVVGGVYREEGYDYGGVAQITSYARGRDGVAMGSLTIEGGLNHPDLVPGRTLTFDGDERGYDSTRLHISMIGCSGPSEGNWDYDVPADEVTVTVEQGETPEQVVLQYEATFDGGSSHTGRVAVEVQ